MKKLAICLISSAVLVAATPSFAVVQTTTITVQNQGVAIPTTSLTLTIKPAPAPAARPTRAARTERARAIRTRAPAARRAARARARTQRSRTRTVRRAPPPIAVVTLSPQPTTGAFVFTYDDEQIREDMVVDVAATLPGGRRIIRRNVPFALIMKGVPIDLAGSGPAPGPAPFLPSAGMDGPSAPPARAAGPGSGCGLAPASPTCFFFGPAFRSRQIPGINAGTRFDIGLGTEVGYLGSATRLSGTGASMGFAIPFNGFSFFVDGEYMPFKTTNRAASIPVGGDNVAFTFLYPNPATGSTGVLFGATGQDASVSTRGAWGEVNVGVNVPVETVGDLLGISQPRAPGEPRPSVTPFFRVGATLSHLRTDQSINQSSIAFANHWMNTSLNSKQYLIAPVFGVGVNAALGSFLDVTVLATIAPGIRSFDGRVQQTVSCPFCPLPGDQAFGSAQILKQSWFAYRASIGSNVNVNFSENFFAGATLRYDFYSKTGFIRNPITPAQQPVSIGKRSTSGWTAMATVGARF